MKRIYSIVIMLLFVFLFVGCSNKYETVYCDFDIGDFNSKGDYQIKSTTEMKTFKETYKTTTSFNDKLKYSDDFFKNKYLVILVMPEEDSKVTYETQSIAYKNGVLTINIKMKNKSTNGSNDNNPMTPTADNNTPTNNENITGNPGDNITGTNPNDMTGNNGSNDASKTNNSKVNKGFILEFKKKDTITKVNLNIT